MSTLDLVCEGLQTALLTITGLDARNYLVDTPSNPSAVISVIQVEYHTTSGPLGEVQFDVTVLVARTDAKNSQMMMQQFLSESGSNSIRAAIESDPTWGGVVSDCIVETGQRGPAITVGSSQTIFLTATFHVTAFP